MADEEREESSPEDEVARVFVAAGYEVTQAVGAAPGEVDWFATPRTGLVRPRTWWKVWGSCPEDLEGALRALEEGREARRADRVCAVVMEGRLPPEYALDLNRRTANALTYRRLVLELSGVVDEVRQAVARYRNSGDESSFLSRRARTSDGRVVDAVTHLEAWATSENTRPLALVGELHTELGEVVDHVRNRIGSRFLEHIDEVIPIVSESIDGDDSLRGDVIQLGWAIPHEFISARRPVNLPSYKALYIAKDHQLFGIPVEWLALLPRDPAQAEEWFRTRLGSATLHERLMDARRAIPAFEFLTNARTNLPWLLSAIHSIAKEEGSSIKEWAARVVARYASDVERALPPPADFEEPLLTACEDVALDEFAVRGSNHVYLSEMIESHLPNPGAVALLTWQADDHSPFNPLIRDYLVARKIAREVRGGHPEILARYQFPQEFVLLFLALLDPEVAARATADRSDATRAEIESEVERRLQLTLAHALKRSAGAARAHLKTIRRHSNGDLPERVAHAFARMDEEITFQAALAEQTRLWHEVPESAIEAVPLHAFLDPLVQDLRQAHPAVVCIINIDPALRVRAGRKVLHEILHCLLENAFQAVAFADQLANPRVEVHARVEGATVRIDVLDNGPGIAEGDRERIFDLYVSTKKGGEGKPLGTGMGLPIARRYAQHIGGQVGLDPDHERTCFFVRLVAWRDLG